MRDSKTRIISFSWMMRMHENMAWLFIFHASDNKVLKLSRDDSSADLYYKIGIQLALYERMFKNVFFE